MSERTEALPHPPGRVSCLADYYALRMPGLPTAVREIRPWPMTAGYRSAVMQWCTDHLLVPTDVGYLIELSDGRVVVKLYDRDENGRPFLRKGEPAHCWRCVTPKRPLPV